jgi:hypothetical protein
LADLTSPPNDPASWLRSEADDIIGSVTATAVTQQVALHPGGDVGSPGTFPGSGGGFAAADFNESGKVDAADLATWKTAFGPSSAADANGDGDSDGADFLTWQRQLGAMTAEAVATPVPEPVTLGLAGLGILTMALGRRRRHAK